MRRTILIVFALASTACAGLHHAPIGERIIESDPQTSRIESSKSSIGTNTEGVERLGKRVIPSHFSLGRSIEGAGSFLIWATSFSPQTGQHTHDDRWADGVDAQLRSECPNGIISGIQTVRETAIYSLLSSEVIRVRAVCAMRSAS